MNIITPKQLNRIILFLAIACGCTVANLYYSQPLLLLISADIQLSNEYNGVITTLTQLGYAIGVFLLVPLIDLVENKRLIIIALFLCIISLLGIIFFNITFIFLTFSLILGLSVAVVQIFVPLSSYITPPKNRGAVIGKIMGGLLLGIMLARPLASFLTELFNWHAIYIFSLLLMLIILYFSFVLIPERRPKSNISYKELFLSTLSVFFTTPILRRRAIYQFTMFGVFSLFWTVTPQLLSSEVFGLSNNGIAIFALIGVGGALAAPIAGKLADKGYIKSTTIFAFILASLSFLIIGIIQLGSFYSLVILAIAGLLIDGCVSLTLITGQKEIYNLDEKNRGRYNAIYIGFFFIGGAVGSSIGSYIYHVFAWKPTMYTSVAILAVTILYFCTEKPSTL